MNDIITVQARSLTTLAAEIRTIHDQTKRAVLYGLIEIGRRLTEAKSLCPHGEWGDWLEREVSYSQTTATNYMNIFKEYGDKEPCLFGNANPQAFENLNYSQLVLLMAVPAEDRETFVQDADVENMSTRELEQAIREMKEARQAKAEVEENLSRAESHILDLEAQLTDQARSIEERDTLAEEQEAAMKKLRQQAEEAEKARAAAYAAGEKLKKQLADAQDREAKARAELKTAKENPDVPQSIMEELRTQVEVEAAQKATEQLQKKLGEAAAAVKKAEADRKAAETAAQAVQEKLEAAQKAASVMDPNVAAIQVLINSMATDWNMIMGYRAKAVAANPENAVKLENGLRALLTKLEFSLNGGAAK